MGAYVKFREVDGKEIWPPLCWLWGWENMPKLDDYGRPFWINAGHMIAYHKAHRKQCPHCVDKGDEEDNKKDLEQWLNSFKGTGPAKSSKS